MKQPGGGKLNYHAGAVSHDWMHMGITSGRFETIKQGKAKSASCERSMQHVHNLVSEARTFTFKTKRCEPTVQYIHRQAELLLDREAAMLALGGLSLLRWASVAVHKTKALLLLWALVAR